MKELKKDQKSLNAPQNENDPLQDLPIGESTLVRIIQMTLDVVIVVDEQQTIQYVNDSFHSTFGYTREEIVGKKLDILLPEGISEQHAAHVRQFAESSDVAIRMEKRKNIFAKHKDGSNFPAMASIIKIVEGDQQRYAVILRDIIELYRNTEKINSTARFPDENPNPVMRFSKDLTLMYANPNSELILNQWGIQVGDRVTSNFAKVLERSFAANTLQETELRVNDHIFSLLIVPIENENYLNIYGQNVTARKLAERNTQRQLRRLSSLRKIDEAIIGNLDLEIVLNYVLEQAKEQLSLDAADILQYNRYINVLEYSDSIGFYTDALKQTQLSLGEGYAGKAALTRQIVHIPDLREYENAFQLSPKFHQEGFVTYFAVPLIVSGKLKGVLEAYTREPFDPFPDWLEFLQTMAGQAALAINNARLLDDLKQATSSLTLAYDETIEGWSHALDLRDKETEGHTQRVTTMTIKLARAMGIPQMEIVHIRRGALLHDIGKMGVPDRILLKPDKLTPEEWDIMRQHPRLAYNMLSPIAYLRPALDIPYCHHEKWDGTGYPRQLVGEQIPLSARIFAVVDVWDALLSDRPYRKGWPLEKVLEHIKSESGKHFDPKVVEVFFEVIQS